MAEKMQCKATPGIQNTSVVSCGAPKAGACDYSGKLDLIEVEAIHLIWQKIQGPGV